MREERRVIMAYPSTVDSYTAKTDGVDHVLAAHVNTLQTSVVAIETELGTDPAGSVPDVKTRLAVSHDDAGNLRFKAVSDLTVSGGVITVTQNRHRFDTEGGAATDDIDTINGLATDGEIVYGAIVNAARNIVLKHGTGNIACVGGQNITLDLVSDVAILIYDGTTSTWFAGKLSSGGGVVSGSGTQYGIAQWATANTLQNATADMLLSSTASVDLNTTSKTTLYTVPAGKSAVITMVIIRAASTSLTTANYGLGFDAGGSDVVTGATHTELTGATLYTKLQAKAGAKLGAAGDVFGLKCSVAQGAPATVTVDVYGYLV